MIEYRKGNLLDVEHGIIAHGCNSYGVMGSGVALAVKQKYLSAFVRYQTYCQKFQCTGILGDIVYEAIEDDLIIANMITQKDFGREPFRRYVSYDAIDDCFKEVTKIAQINGLTIHIPKIGAGLGNGDWSVIEKIIECRCPTVNVICWEL